MWSVYVHFDAVLEGRSQKQKTCEGDSQVLGMEMIPNFNRRLFAKFLLSERLYC